MGKAMLWIAMVFAELESGIKSERITDWHSHRRAAGAPPSGPLPYGYGPGRIPDPTQVDIITEAAARVLAGEGLRGISIKLNAEGRHRPGRPWNSRTLRHVLLNPHTAGLRNVDGVLVPGSWEPLMERTTYDQLCTILKDPARRNGHSSAPKWLLTGIVACALCDTPLTSAYHVSGFRYVCKQRKGYPGCGRISIACAPVDAEVVGAVLTRLAGGYEATAAGFTADPRSMIPELEQQRVDLARRYGDGDLTAEEWEALRAAITRRIAEAEAAPASMPLPSAVDWPTLPLATQRAVVGVLFEAITIVPARPGVTPVQRIHAVWRA
jgi:hypothetical protein